MSVFVTPQLRNALRIDAVVSGAAGLLMVLGSGLLAQPLSLPQPLLFWAGLAFLPWCGALLWAGARKSLPRLVVLDVIGLNALFVAICVILPFSGLIAPNLLGTTFILAQGAVVAAFVAMQYAALRATASLASA